jgi:hypothetical protein
MLRFFPFRSVPVSSSSRGGSTTRQQLPKADDAGGVRGVRGPPALLPLPPPSSTASHRAAVDVPLLAAAVDHIHAFPSGAAVPVHRRLSPAPADVVPTPIHPLWCRRPPSPSTAVRQSHRNRHQLKRSCVRVPRQFFYYLLFWSAPIHSQVLELAGSDEGQQESAAVSSGRRLTAAPPPWTRLLPSLTPATAPFSVVPHQSSNQTFAEPWCMSP